MLIKNDKAVGNAAAGAQQADKAAAAKPAYEVGFGKPPKAGQFKKGKSGNPKGRPKGALISDVAPLIEMVFSETVKIRDGEQIRTVSNLEATLHAQIVHALKGEPKAIRTVFDLGAKAGLFSKSQQKSFIKIVEPHGEARKILRGYHAENAQQSFAIGPTAQVTDAASTSSNKDR